MLFTMADNKELLCIVAASPLLIGRWSRCTKSHIVKLRQKHMSRKSLSVLCCLGHSCYPINNIYMIYIYVYIYSYCASSKDLDDHKGLFPVSDATPSQVLVLAL